jgi:hypothetical protein
VIFLHSHPTWVAAQQRARQRNESMRRHPSSRQRAAGDVAVIFPSLRLHPSADTPA